MKNLYYLPGFIFVFLLLNSCNRVEKFDANYFENLTGKQPRKALEMLNKIKDPTEMNMRDYARFTLYKIMAKDKCNQTINNDSSIKFSYRYFIENKDYRHAAYSLFYCGRIYMENKEYEKSMKSFIQTDSLLQTHHIINTYLSGMNAFYKGELFRIQDCYPKAKECYENSMKFFKGSGNLQNENSSRISLAYIYLLNNEFYAALNIYNQALEYALSKKDSLSISEILSRRGSIYKKTGDDKNAVRNFHSAIRFDKTSVNPILEILQLCDLYIDTNQNDSAKIYLDQALQYISQSGKPAQAKYYECLSEFYKKTGDNEEAFKYYRMSEELKQSELVSHENKSVLKIDNDHNLSKMKRKYIYSLYTAIFSSLCLIASFLKNLGTKRKKKEMEDKYFSCVRMKDHTAVLLSEYLEILKRNAIHATKFKDERERKRFEAINRLIYGTSDIKIIDWHKFQSVLNELYNNKLKKLEEKYPELDEREIKIFSLELSGLDTSEISRILDIDQNYLRKIKSYIRKKMGIKDGRSLVLILNSI